MTEVFQVSQKLCPLTLEELGQTSAVDRESAKMVNFNKGKYLLDELTLSVMKLSLKCDQVARTQTHAFHRPLMAQPVLSLARAFSLTHAHTHTRTI